MKKVIPRRMLRMTALIMVITGVLASLGFMLYAGRDNDSILLILLFIIWVSSPFISMIVSFGLSRRMSEFARSALYWLMIALSLVSIVVYSGILIPSGVKPAFVFLVMPFLSWVVIVLLVIITTVKSRRFSIKRIFFK